MRSWSLILLVLVCAGCTVRGRLPRPGEIGISVKTSVHVEARAQTTVAPEAQVIVPVQGAAVVEFFGIPLEGAQDVVFVLDCSGSMANLAQGRVAEIRVPSSPPPAEPPPGSTAPSAGAPTPPAEPPPQPDVPPDAPPDAPPADAVPAPEQPIHTQPRKIDVAQAELIAALEQLPVGTRMNVIFFNRDLLGFAPNVLSLDETSRAGLIRFVRLTTPTGSTALAPAMRTAFLMNARRIVLLSDGLGNVGGNADTVLRDAREAIRGGVRIDTIGIGQGQHAELLSALARESGGLYQPL